LRYEPEIGRVTTRRIAAKGGQNWKQEKVERR
jgi:hypothetical protein